MSDETSATGGQAPTTSTPQAGTSQTSGQAPDGATQQSKPSMTLEEAMRELEATRKESAERRVKLKDYESQLKTFQDAQLSESERKDRDFAALQGEHSMLQERYQRLVVRQSVLDAAPDLGYKGKLAAGLLDWSSLKIDEDGKVTNLKEALDALAKEYPDIRIEQQPPSNQPQPRSYQQMPPANPARQQPEAQPINPRTTPWGAVWGNKRQ